MASFLLGSLGVFLFIDLQILVTSWILGIICFTLIGFCIYSTHVLMVTTMPVDFSIKGGSASITGFFEVFGYLGVTVLSFVSDLLIDNYGW